MSEPLAFLNGRMMPQSQAHLALNDAGFIYGATVTDLCRTFRHRLYRWPDHIARFRQSCRSAFLDVSSVDETITRWAHDLVAHNAGLIGSNHDLALVLFATPGPIGFYLGESVQPNEQPTFGMHTFPLPFARYRSWIESGVSLATPSVRQVPPTCVDPRIKQRSRMHWWLAEQEVRRTHPGSQALLLDENDCITETASSNFLLVKAGVVISPPLERILGGVSLQVVTELCTHRGIPMEHRPITVDECRTADEAILTCTSYCIAGVREWNGRELPFPGPIMRRILEAWSSEVGVDIHQQILQQ